MQLVRILVAEDERPIRAGICRMLEDYFSTRRPPVPYLIQETGNGQDAYRICLTEPVDVLVTDIKMPALSGLSLARRLTEGGYPVHILAVSGYQDFEYVRGMLKLGVYDYLIKPISQNKLWEAMDYFLSHLNTPRAATGATLQLEQRQLEYLLLRTPDFREDYEELRERYGVGEDMGCEAFFVRADAGPKSRALEIHSLVNSFCSGYEGVVTVQGELRHWVILCIYPGGTPPDGFSPLLVRALEEQGFRLHSRHLLDSLAQVYLLHLDLSVAFYNLEHSPSPPDPVTEFRRIEDAVLGDLPPEILAEGVEGVFQSYQAAQTSREAMKKDFSDLSYHLMQRNADAIEFISKATFSPYDLMEGFEDAETLSSLRDHALRSLERLRGQLALRRDQRKDSTITRVLRYIGEHYASDLQLQQAAEHVHLHPNYLSTLFRQKTGISFREHLRKVRVERAMELLREGSVPVSRIAELVGYGDTAHFFRAFKNVTGMTPKLYKKSCGDFSPQD